MADAQRRPFSQKLLPAEVLVNARAATSAMRCPSNTQVKGRFKTELNMTNVCSCGRWRFLLPAVFSALQLRGSGLDPTVANGHVYQFGVYKGQSMRLLRQIFKNSSMFGFDSFEGLPKDVRGKEPWKPGMFRSDPRASLLRDLNRANAPVQFVSGFYSESLTKAGLVQQLGMQPAKYVDVDVDLYSSTVDVLDFLFVHGLIAPGTVIGFDDFWSIACLSNSDEDSSPLAGGEALALVEAARRYNATFLCLAGGCRRSRQDEERDGRKGGACSAFGAIFLVSSIFNASGGDPSAGFELSQVEIVDFKRHDPVCRVNRVKPLGADARGAG